MSLPKLDCDQVFVIHVSKGYEDRAAFIKKQFASMGIDFKFMLKGDITDLTPDVVSDLFTEDCGLKPSSMSCAYKHYLAMKEIAASDGPGGLILEDDILLDKKFNKVFNQSLKEAQSLGETEYLINYERCRYVPLLRLRPGKHLYKMGETKLTGVYFISKDAAKKFTDYIDEHKMQYPADWLQTKLFNMLEMSIFWCEPTLGEQGSKNGMFSSELSGTKASPIKRISWFVSQLYKQYLLRLFRFY